MSVSRDHRLGLAERRVSTTTMSNPAASQRATLSAGRRATRRVFGLGWARGPDIKAGEHSERRARLHRAKSPRTEPPVRRRGVDPPAPRRGCPRPVRFQAEGLRLKVDFPTPAVTDSPTLSASRPVAASRSSSASAASRYPLARSRRAVMARASARRRRQKPFPRRRCRS